MRRTAVVEDGANDMRREAVDLSASPDPGGPAEFGLSIAPCPVCGFDMMAVRGSTQAVCSNCGFKDSCCY